jgi:hypothetical protein
MEASVGICAICGCARKASPATTVHGATALRDATAGKLLSARLPAEYEITGSPPPLPLLASIERQTFNCSRLELDRTFAYRTIITPSWHSAGWHPGRTPAVADELVDQATPGWLRTDSWMIGTHRGMTCWN